MKAKYVNDDYLEIFKDPEAIYDVETSLRFPYMYHVFLQGESMGDWFQDRFEIIEEITEKSLETQLQEARDSIASLCGKIDDAYDLISSLEELQKQKEAKKILDAKIKVGQKYKHSDDSIYMVCSVGSQFALICIEDKLDPEYAGDCYYGYLSDNIDDIFGNHEEVFTLIK